MLKNYIKISENYRNGYFLQFLVHFNPLSANSTKWSNTLKQLVGKRQRIVSVSDHFVGLALKV